MITDESQILHPNTKEAYDLLHKGALALSRVEQQGFRVNRKYLRRTIQELDSQVIDYEKQFYASPFYKSWKKAFKKKINIYSGQQLGIYLYSFKKIKPPKLTATGQGSTDDEALKQLNIPELDLIVQAKKLKKARDTYLKSFLREQVNGFVHPFFNLHLVRTFRSSADRPNFQNIPKRDKEIMNLVRRAIYPRKGHQLLELDYSQLEVRIAAAYHKDPTMLHEIETGHDFHKDLAIEIFKLKKFGSGPSHKILRAAAKNGFVFPQFYGDYYANNAKGLAQWGELPEERKWKKTDGIDFEGKKLGAHMLKNGFKGLPDFTAHLKEMERRFWQERYPVYAKWKENWFNEYQSQGYVWSKTGFTLQGYMTKNDVINYPVQGAAFHVLLWSLIEGVKALQRERMKSKIVGQIHDAIIFDIYPPELNKVINIMKCIMCNDVKQKMPWINTPLEVEAELCGINKSWATKDDYEIN